MPKLFYPEILPQEFKDLALALDTNIFIEAAKFPELQNLLIKIKNAGCLLLSTPLVRSEFLRGAKNLKERHNLETLFGVLNIVFVQGLDKMAFLPDIGNRFQLLVHKLVPKASIPDEELLFLTTMLASGRKINLMTISYKDVPQELYDCKHVITIQDKDGLRTAGIYSLNEKLFSSKFFALT